MRIQAEVSVYPLKEQHLSEPIALLRSTLARYRLATKTGTMIAEVAGDSKDVFRGLRDAFERLAEQHDIVLVCKVSNCCAVSASGGREAGHGSWGPVRRQGCPELRSVDPAPGPPCFPPDSAAP